MLDNNKIKKEAIIIKQEVKDEAAEFSGVYHNLEQNIDNALNTGSLGIPGKC